MLTAICVLTSLLGCEKTKLDGDMGVLVGTWAWTQTSGLYVTGGAYHFDPSTEGHDYCLEFKEKGKMCMYVDLKKDKCVRMLLDGEGTDGSGDPYYRFGFSDRDEYWVITVRSNDSIIVTGYPQYEVGISFQNFYLRQ